MRPRPRVRCLLLLGGNVGDRWARLLSAVRRLRALPSSRITAKSRLYETSPIGPGGRRYLNMAVKLETGLSPMGLLVECKRLESAAGRRPGRRWGPRPLDIDIISYGSLRLRSAWLSIPHPRAAQRAFALAPLADIAPAWKPRLKRSVRALLSRLNPGPETVKIFIR